MGHRLSRKPLRGGKWVGLRRGEPPRGSGGYMYVMAFATTWSSQNYVSKQCLVMHVRAHIHALDLICTFFVSDYMLKTSTKRPAPASRAILGEKNANLHMYCSISFPKSCRTDRAVCVPQGVASTISTTVTQNFKRTCWKNRL